MSRGAEAVRYVDILGTWVVGKYDIFNISNENMSFSVSLDHATKKKYS